jgi:hypothetical protein
LDESLSCVSEAQLWLPDVLFDMVVLAKYWQDWTCLAAELVTGFGSKTTASERRMVVLVKVGLGRLGRPGPRLELELAGHGKGHDHTPGA